MNLKVTTILPWYFLPQAAAITNKTGQTIFQYLHLV